MRNEGKPAALLLGEHSWEVWMWESWSVLGTAQSSGSETFAGSGCLFFPRVLSCLLTSYFLFLSFSLFVFYGLDDGK